MFCTSRTSGRLRWSNSEIVVWWWILNKVTLTSRPIPYSPISVFAYFVFAYSVFAYSVLAYSLHSPIPCLPIPYSPDPKLAYSVFCLIPWLFRDSPIPCIAYSKSFSLFRMFAYSEEIRLFRSSPIPCSPIPCSPIPCLPIPWKRLCPCSPIAMIIFSSANKFIVDIIYILSRFCFVLHNLLSASAYIQCESKDVFSHR